MSNLNVHVCICTLFFFLFPHLIFSHGHGTKHKHKQIIELDDEKKIDLKFSGYVRMDSFFDSRENVDYWRGLDIAFPKNKLLDPNGCDINDKSQYNMVPYSSLRLHAKGPDLWNAKTSAKIKTDFSGKVFTELVDDGLLADYGNLRLQHAYFQLDWEKTKLRAGLYYHPMTILRYSSDTVSINAGEMFDPFQYSAHVYVKHHIDRIQLVGAVGKIYHRRRFREAICPNILGQVNYVTKEKNGFGVGVDFRMEVPRLETDVLIATGLGDSSNSFKTQQNVKSVCCFFVSKLKHKELTWTSRLMYAENAYIYGLLGGYGTKKRNPVTDRREYTNIRSISAWTDFFYNNSRWEVGFFMGVAKNIGARDEILRHPNTDEFLVFGLGLDIDKLFRFQPRVRIFRGPITFGIELEHTRAWYGTTNKNGKVDDSCPVHNTRVVGSVIYAW